MKKIILLFSIIFLSCAPLQAAEPIAAGTEKKESPLSRMLSRAERPKFKAAREGGVQKRVTTPRKTQSLGGYSTMTPEEFQAFFREEELPPSQEMLDLGARLYALLQRSEESYDKAQAFQLFREFKDMGGQMTITGDRVASRRLNEMRRERLRVLRRSK